jgi:zinc transporter, ZIP family
VISALGWGAVAAASLVIGGVLATLHEWPERLVGLVLAFGAGALISAVAFDLFEEGQKLGGPGTVAIGLAAGGLTYFALDRLVETKIPGAGPALALGALLDGIPEQAVLGIGLGAGESISVGLLAAIFVSNLPESIGASADLDEAGTSRGKINLLWLAVAVVCTLATVGGYALADATGGNFRAAINGFAAGALLVMLVDSMIPEASKKAGRPAGLVTVLGFAVAAALS